MAGFTIQVHLSMMLGFALCANRTDCEDEHNKQAEGKSHFSAPRIANFALGL